MEDEDVCPHEAILSRVACLLTAAAMRCGGRLEFTEQELQDAGYRSMAIAHNPGTHTVSVATALLVAPEVPTLVHPMPERPQ